MSLDTPAGAYAPQAVTQFENWSRQSLEAAPDLLPSRIGPLQSFLKKITRESSAHT
jgi:hypothetical protein